MKVWLLLTFCVLGTSTQECGVSNLPVSVQDSSDVVPLPSNRQQVLITSYQFTCCGVVTEWGAYIKVGGGNGTDTNTRFFQIWRPLGEGVYELVGENAVSGTPNGSLIIVGATEPLVQFQPGDVIGYATGNLSELGALENNSSHQQVYVGQRLTDSEGTFINISESIQLPPHLAPILHVAVSNQSCAMTTSTSLTVTSTTGTGTAPAATDPVPGNENQYQQTLIAALIPSLLLVLVLVVVSTIVIIICTRTRIKRRQKGYRHRDEFVGRLKEGVEEQSIEFLVKKGQQTLENEKPMFSGSGPSLDIVVEQLPAETKDYEMGPLNGETVLKEVSHADGNERSAAQAVNQEANETDIFKGE